MTWLIDDEFCFFLCLDQTGPEQEMKGINMYMCSLFGHFGTSFHFHTSRISFVCPVAFPSKDSHQEFPVCWRRLLDRKHWGYKNGKREREFGACQSSRVVRCSFDCRFSDGFLKSTTHGGNESKICHQGLLAKNMSRKEVPTNSYDLDEIGRQKMVF